MAAKKKAASRRRKNGETKAAIKKKDSFIPAGKGRRLAMWLYGVKTTPKAEVK